MRTVVVMCASFVLSAGSLVATGVVPAAQGTRSAAAPRAQVHHTAVAAPTPHVREIQPTRARPHRASPRPATELRHPLRHPQGESLFV